MSERKREYKFFATARRGKFSTKTYDYEMRTHRWTYTVYARSIKEAYWLASQDKFAEDSRSVGVRKIEMDWWHLDRVSKSGPKVPGVPPAGYTPQSALEAGLIVVAPYLKGQELIDEIVEGMGDKQTQT